MIRTKSALRLTVFVAESATWHSRPLHAEILRLAQAAGLAGGSVLRGMEGFGPSGVRHTSRLFSMSGDLPLTVILVDEPDRIRAFLPRLDDVIAKGLAVLDEVEVVFHLTDGEER